MNILLVASEAAPYLQTGDVAKVITGLSIALRKQGHDARVVIPRYRGMNLDTIPYPITGEFDVQIGAYTHKARLWRTDYDATRLPVYFIENQFYFGRENPYGYLDDYERFIFFTRAVIEMFDNPEFQSECWYPEVIHGHDWSTGLLPMCMQHTYKDRLSMHPISFVYTIHNVGFPGEFGYRAINIAGLTDLGIYESIGETSSSISFMARGILAADAVNTVSPQHAKEIQNEEYDHSLAKALKASKKNITGILNGLDYTVYNPSFDATIKYNFDRDTLERRKENKQTLQEECGLIVDPQAPLIGMVCRLIREKGVGLLEELLLTLIEEGVQVVIVGAVGDYRYREVFTRFQNEHHEQFAPFFTSLDDPLSHRLLAGADIMLVPSLREPCGSQQMLAVRYGAIPVVHRTGGLADTVAPWNADIDANIGKGFLFDRPDAGSFLQAIRDALHLYHADRGLWQELQRHNMMVEFSWSRSARQYINLYQESLLASQSRYTLSKEYAVPIQLDQGDLLVQAILEVGELTTAIIEQEEYLKHVARNVQELLKGDAVLIWKWDEKDPQKLSPEGYSFARDANGFQQEFNPDLYQIFSEQDSRTWQFVYRLDSENLGFLGSELARQRSWTGQLSAPMNTHGAYLGRIDVFSCDHAREFSTQDRNTLRAFASAIAVNLEKNRLSKEAENLLTAAREMAQEQTVDKIAEVVLRHTKNLTHTSAGLLYLSDGRFCSLDESNKFKVTTLNRTTEPQPGTHIPDTAVRVADVFDGAADAPDTVLHLLVMYNSHLRSELTNGDHRVFGEIIVFKPQPVAFSHNDEVVLQSLAAQAANALQAAYSREQDDQSRVEQLRKLANSLVGGVDFDTLLERVVTTTAEALQAEAASLYLVEDDDTDKLMIRAAYGYHKPLLKEKASYRIGEGTTGWIAQVGKTFKADSLEELHSKTPWKGKHKLLQEGEREPNVFLGIPLKITDKADPLHEEVIGVLKLEDRKPVQRAFTDQDMRLGEMMANVIVTVIQNTRLSDIRLRELSTNLQTLSTAMVGGLEMSALVQRIVDTIARVLSADASALYLIEPNTRVLKVQAGTGYQKNLMAQGASYDIEGEGLTAWIAREGKSFKANSIDELHSHAHWAGKYTNAQEGREPNVFLGIPLKVITAGREEVIGVLKVEGVRPSSRHPESYFTDQDQLLVEMMGNVITTVIQNTRLSDIRLRELNTNLQTLSTAMVGGLEISVLVRRIVDTIARVLGTDASSLYVIEPDTQVLKAQAGTGYQKELVAQGASYDIEGEGLTAWIAREGKSFKANSIDELHSHAHWAGKYTSAQRGREPNVFLGIPLKVITAGREEVIGVLKVEGVRSSRWHPESYFTDQDQLLVEMMGNVIIAVIQNIRLSNAALEPVLAQAFHSILSPKLDSASYDLLHPFVSNDNDAVLNAISSVLLSLFPNTGQVSLEEKIDKLLEQTRELLRLDVNPMLFRTMARRSKDNVISRWYTNLYELRQKSNADLGKIPDALLLEQTWEEAADAAKRMIPKKLHQDVERLTLAIAQSTEGEVVWSEEDGHWTAYKMQHLLSGSSIRALENLPMLFFKGPQWRAQEDLDSFRSILLRLKKDGLGNIIGVVSFLPDAEVEEASRDLRRELKAHAIDFIFFTLKDFQDIVSAKQPQQFLQSRLLPEISLLTVSPYQINGPTPDNMFFGREGEVREITDRVVSTSYAVIGGRRVGKSSLLGRLHRVSLPDAGFRTISYDCSTTSTYESFMAAPISSWRPDREWHAGLPATFGDLLKSPPTDKPLVLLLDEADKLVPPDRSAGWQLFSVLRNMVNSGHIQVVLCGEHTLRDALRDPNSPLFNFVNEKLLGPLDYNAVKELVTRPMKQLKIDFVEEKTIVELIWDFTSGHPNVVQRLCSKLILLLNNRDIRRIRPDDVIAVIDDPKFQEDDFLKTYWERATPLEQIISLLMAQEDKPYRLHDILAMLNSQNLQPEPQIETIRSALDRLVTLRSILKHHQTGYKFAVKAFPKVLANTTTVEDLLLSLKNDYIKNPV